MGGSLKLSSSLSLCGMSCRVGKLAGGKGRLDLDGSIKYEISNLSIKMAN